MSTRPMAGHLLLALGFALALAGCAGGAGTETPGDASARVAVSTSALSAAVGKVEVTVSKGAGTPDFTPITVSLSQVGATWSGFITGITAGTGRQFDVVAFDASGAQVATGSGRADVVAAGTATVAIVLSANTPGNPYQNSAPVIDFISASETLVQAGAKVRLQALAHDPDPTDAISYAWIATCGTIASPASPAVEWIAPAAPGSCQISLVVNDNRGASVAAYLVIEVGILTTGDVLVTATGGNGVAPVISGMAAQVTYDDRTSGALVVIAMDPGGGALTYAWSSDCSGLVFDTAAPNSPAAPMFTSTDTARTCAITVTVTNATGSRTTAVVQIGPRPNRNVGPIITATIQPTVDLSDPAKAEPVRPGDAVALGVLATDPEGQGLTFAWAASAGTLDAQVDQTTSPGRSSVVFHVPATIPAGLQVTVTVSDPLGASNVHVFRLKAAAG
jgi:hypothetical protein